MKKELTDKQRRVLSFIKDFISDKGYPPTRAEISTALGFSFASGAQVHIVALERKGWLSVNSGKPRSMRVL